MLLPRGRVLIGALILGLAVATVVATRRPSAQHPAPVAIVPARPALAASTIADENRLPGSTDWAITRPARHGEIAAYAGATSVNAGDVLDLYVSTRANGDAYDADIYRMGWYGGAGARKVLSFQDIAGADQGWWDPQDGLHDCATCTIDPATLLVTANWKPSLQIRTQTGWVSGYYLIKLRELATGTSTYAMFVLRNDASAAPLLVQAPTNTWQAYNTWGDASLYGSFGANRKYVAKTRRAYRVSFDRPYDPTINHSANDGAGEFFSWEYDFVRWAESRGYEMSYTTNVDVALRPQTLTKHRLFVSLGHDEYWTRPERDAVDAARDAGVSVAFFGGNEAYWQARLDASPAGQPGRILTEYKDARLDPIARTDPKEATVRFTDAPVGLPESRLSGLAYGSTAVPDYQPWHAADVSSWVFAGTGITAGEAFPGVVGYEYDRLPAPEERPVGLDVVGRSAVRGFVGRDTAISALYVADSGATVFDAGTIAWSWGLDDYGHESRGHFANNQLRRMTANIIDRLGAPPAADQLDSR